MGEVSIKNLTRGRRPRGPFSAIAKKVLPGWDISLVLVGEKRAQALNTRLRHKTYVPNVLSYAVGKRSAEVIICPSIASREAPRYGLSPSRHLLLLFIHGLLHIKGWAHSGRMEKCERTLLSTFAYETTHRHRHRHRHLPGKGRRR